MDNCSHENSTKNERFLDCEECNPPLSQMADFNKIAGSLVDHFVDCLDKESKLTKSDIKFLKFLLARNFEHVSDKVKHDRWTRVKKLLSTGTTAQRIMELIGIIDGDEERWFSEV